MFNKDNRVKIKPYQRTRTIFNNAEYFPGKVTQYKGGWEGIVTGIFEGLGEDIIEVLREDTQDEFSEGSYYSFSPNELTKI